MAKRNYRASKRYKVKTHRKSVSRVEEVNGEVLEDMLACPSTGCDLGTKEITKEVEDEDVEELLKAALKELL